MHAFREFLSCQTSHAALRSTGTSCDCKLPGSSFRVPRDTRRFSHPLERDQIVSDRHILSDHDIRQPHGARAVSLCACAWRQHHLHTDDLIDHVSIPQHHLCTPGSGTHASVYQPRLWKYIHATTILVSSWNPAYSQQRRQPLPHSHMSSGNPRLHGHSSARH
jgi:hypothetical protein